MAAPHAAAASAAAGGTTSLPARARGGGRLRVAVNLLTEDPRAPSGAHWFWTRMIPEMQMRLGPREELCLLVSPQLRPLHGDYGPQVKFVTYPWSNERRNLRTLSEHLYSPVRLPLAHIDVLNTLIAPVLNPSWSLVIHMKTMHAFTAPGSLTFGARTYRKMAYPRTARLAQAIIINSKSIQREVEEHVEIDRTKLRLVYEAVDHAMFKPGDRSAARAGVASHGVTRPFVLFVSSLWPYKNCEGLLRAVARVREELRGRQLAVVGPARDKRHAEDLRHLARDLGIGQDVVFVGGVGLAETVAFYQAADVFVYPSTNETFGLPILEAMACACPVVTSRVSSMPEVAGGAAVLCDPLDPGSIGQALLEALRSGDRLRDAGLRRAGEFTWGSTAERTLDVYREVGERRQSK